jgi:hypothetical protein
MQTTPEESSQTLSANKRIRQIAWLVFALVTLSLLGIVSSYLNGARRANVETFQKNELTQLCKQVNPEK